MDVTIKEVSGKRDLKSFVYFPYWLYKDGQNWVPEPKQLAFFQFDKKDNPIYNHADARLYLAMKDKRVAGRVAVFAFNDEFEHHSIIRFGWLDFENDKRVGTALFNAIKSAAEELGARKIIGPTSFDWFINHGVLATGFNTKDSLLTPYHLSHQHQQMASFGFEIYLERAAFESKNQFDATASSNYYAKSAQSKKELESWLSELINIKDTSTRLRKIQGQMLIDTITSTAKPKDSLAFLNRENRLVGLVAFQRPKSSIIPNNKREARVISWIGFNDNEHLDELINLLLKTCSNKWGSSKIQTSPIVTTSNLYKHLENSGDWEMKKSWLSYILPTESLISQP